MLSQLVAFLFPQELALVIQSCSVMLWIFHGNADWVLGSLANHLSTNHWCMEYGSLP